MNSIPGFTQSVFRAVVRARFPVLTIFLTYVASIAFGILLTHTGNSYALQRRDQLVNRAINEDPASIAYNRGDHLQAALFDFGANLIIGALPKSIGGMAVITAYPFVAYQGWIGGIVSVRADHSSRLDGFRSAVYYLLTLLLQISVYSLAIGSGVNVGVAILRPRPFYQGNKWLGIFPVEALRDAGRIYALAVPLFLLASLWEFLSPWNL